MVSPIAVSKDVLGLNNQTNRSFGGSPFKNDKYLKVGFKKSVESSGDRSNDNLLQSFYITNGTNQNSEARKKTKNRQLYDTINGASHQVMSSLNQFSPKKSERMHESLTHQNEGDRNRMLTD